MLEVQTLSIPVVLAGQSWRAETTASFVSAYTLSLSSQLVGQDGPWFELESTYCGMPLADTRSAHAVCAPRGRATYARVHADGAQAEWCMPLCRPRECLLDHAGQLLDQLQMLVDPRASVEALGLELRRPARA